MLLCDFEGECAVDSETQLMTQLRAKRKGIYGAFILAHVHNGPSLWLHINKHLAYVHYFPFGGGNHAGFQAAGMCPPDCPAVVHFLLTDGNEGSSFDMPDVAVCPVESAYEAATEFYLDASRPTCITWTEL